MENGVKISADNEAVGLSSFYFSFGSAKQFPFERGYLVVLAENRREAIGIFRYHYPDVNEGIINCADIYTEEQWQRTEMADGAWGLCHIVLKAEAV